MKLEDSQLMKTYRVLTKKNPNSKKETQKRETQFKKTLRCLSRKPI